MGPPKTAGAFEEVFSVVGRIPHGRVMTYGQISRLLRHPLSPLAVGWALHQCPGNLPWHRVVNARGACSTDRLPDHSPGLQQALLESEGVAFDSQSKLDLDRFLWWPEE